MMMASVIMLLVNSLEELRRDDLMKFKWHLKNNGRFSRSELENADVFDTVDRMMAHFGPEEAVKIMVNILRKMKQNLLAEELENKLKEEVMMASVEKLLVNSLMDLTTDYLKLFQWHLKNNGRFSASELEYAGVLRTVNRMMAHFRPEEAVKITVDILRKMNHFLLAEELENKLKEVNQRRNIASVKELLMISLKELGTDYLKGFQWHLKNDGRIPASELENAGVLQTVDKMVAHFRPEEAVKITVDILRKMNQNNLTGELNEELLVKSLMDLGTADLKGFQWYLKNDGHIPASEMENADVSVTVDKMVAHFGPEEAVKITVDILRKMNQNRLAEQLENKHKKAQTEGRMKASFTFGADSKQTEGSTLVDSKADLHDYTAEVGVSHKFSEPNPSGLNIHPLLNCQSCVHIDDSDQWVQIEPSACTDEGGSKFRVSTDPGCYECVRTRMRWVCDCYVTLQYRTVDGRFLNADLKKLQCNRIAPVTDVTVISGKLEEVHLPHYACLGESDPSLKDSVKLLTVKDEGITTEPVQLTRFHAKIDQPSFSLITLIISWIMRVDEHCDLLLYMRSKAPLILHVYIFPFDDCAKEKVEKSEKSSDPILHPRPDRPFRMNTPHILDVPGASVHPKEGITLRRETDPNFFKVKTRLENDLQMTLIREEDQKTVWTATIEKDELDHEIHPKRDEPRLNSEAGKAQFFDNHWPDLIQGVKTVGIIADKLHQQKIINKEQYSEITHNSLTSQESMRKICDIIRKHSDAVKAKFISILQKEELYLLEHLYDSTPRAEVMYTYKNALKQQ